MTIRKHLILLFSLAMLLTAPLSVFAQSCECAGQINMKSAVVPNARALGLDVDDFIDTCNTFGSYAGSWNCTNIAAEVKGSSGVLTEGECTAYTTKDLFLEIGFTSGVIGVSEYSAKCTYSDTASTTTTTSSSTANRDAITPTLAVDIPGLTFSTPTEDTAGNFSSTFLADYIGALYNYLVGIGTLIAIIFIMIGGLQWAFGGTSPNAVGKGKERIKNAVTGLTLLLASYLILWTVNPGTILFQTPTFTAQASVELDTLVVGAYENCGDIQGIVGQCSATTLKKPSKGRWSDDLVKIVNTVSAAQGVDPILVATHLTKETGGIIDYPATDPTTGEPNRGPCGEIGVGQFMPTTYEMIYPGSDCCSVHSGKYTNEARVVSCDNKSEPWEPDTSVVPHCRTDICDYCQVAKSSCVDYFDTSKPAGITNSVEATAILIKTNLGRLNDIALSMCAYNGSGPKAAKYASTAKDIYDQICKDSGGTN